MPPETDSLYRSHMLEALALAENGRGKTAPNPCVGALLVQNGNIAASGWHDAYGGDHAEVAVIKDALAKGVDPKDCVLIVTLEPCNHHGKTPPCTQTVLQAGIKKVVFGAKDPTPEAQGGSEYLAARGVEVQGGVAEEACLESLADFLHWRTSPLPYTILKLASTLDGRIATRTGHSKWITCRATRQKVQKLRELAGAILVGGNTFYQDNPHLTRRIPGTDEAAPKQPLAVLATSRLPAVEAQYHLLRERPDQTIFWTTVAAAASPKAEALRLAGVRILGLPSYPRANSKGPGMRAELDLEPGLLALRRDLGCHYVLCEGGGRLGMALLEKNLATELHLHLAPKILGDNDATPLFDGRSPLQMNEALNLRLLSADPSGGDIILIFRPGGLEEASKKFITVPPEN